MLQDPENCDEWQATVRAKSADEAMKKCEAIAENYPLTEVIQVSQETTTPYNKTYKFTCWFRSEITED